MGGENNKFRNGPLMLGEHYRRCRHYRHYIHIFDIFDLSHIYKMQMVTILLHLNSSFSAYSCRLRCGPCGVVVVLLPVLVVLWNTWDVSLVSPKSRSNNHHVITKTPPRDTKTRPDSLRFAQILPPRRPLGVLICTHLYCIVQYNPN